MRELKLPISESRVSTLIRSPCVAIRYVTTDRKVRLHSSFLAQRGSDKQLQYLQVRRFQLRFPSHEVFESAVSILKSIGLPLHQALPSNTPSVGTASVRPDSSSQSRPTSTAQEQLISSQETLSVAKSPELPPYRTEKQGPNGAATLSSLLPSPAFFRDSALSEGRPSFDFSMPPPDNRLRSAGTIPSTNQWSAGQSQDWSVQGRQPLPRPATTPGAAPQMSDSLSQVLPPRRILPFDMPTTRSRSKTPAVSGGLEGTQSQDAPSISEPPASKKPAAGRKKPPAKPKAKPKAPPKAKSKPAKAPKAQKGQKADEATQTVPEMTNTGVHDSPAEINQMVDAPVEVPASQPVEPAAPASALGADPVEVSVTGRKRSSAEMDDEQGNEQISLSALCPSCQHPLTQPADSQGGSSKRTMPIPLANPIHSPAPPAPEAESISPQSPIRTEPAGSKPAPRPPPTANTNLAAYAAQSDEARFAAIDTFICQNLLDDDFLKLCEDVERSWRRIGLGPSAAGGSGVRVSQRISQIARSADAALFENLCCD